MRRSFGQRHGLTLVIEHKLTVRIEAMMQRAFGFHPFAKPEDLTWVPKLRYGIMREYLPTRGARSLDK